VESEQQSGSEPQSGIADALTRLEARAESAAAGWRLLLYAIILSPLAFSAAWISTLGVNDRGFLGFSALCSVGLSILVFWYCASSRKVARRSLRVSDLAKSIAAKDLSGHELREAIPWPWRIWIRDCTTLEQTLRQVTEHLDWYLQYEKRRFAGLKPARLLRFTWVLLPLSLGVSILGLVRLLQLLYWHYSRSIAVNSPLWVYAALGVILPLFYLPLLYFRRQIWTQELARHLLEKLDL